MQDETPNPYESPAFDTEPSVVKKPSTQLAGRLERFAAKFVDGIIGTVIAMPIMFFTGYFDRAMQQQVQITELVGYAIFGIVAYIVIHGYFLATRGQSLGKMLIKIRIVDYPTGELASPVRVIFLRDLLIGGLLANIPVVGPFLTLIDVLFIFSGEKRCLHDLIANTKVVKA